MNMMIEDTCMVDRSYADDKHLDKSTEDKPELEIITEDKFHRPDSERTLKTVKIPISKDKRSLTTVKQQEQTVECLAQELEGAEKRLEVSASRLRSTKNQLRRCEKELAAAQTQLVELQHCRTKLAAAQQDLVACKDDIFRLQPIPQVPDSAITKDFESLCHQIMHWIEAEVVAFERANPQHEHEHIFSIGDNRVAARFLTRHPAAGECLARYLIHRFLINHVFHPDVYLLGLSDNTKAFLRSTEESMARLDPPRGVMA